MEKKGRVTLLNGFMTSVNLPNFIEIGISSVTYRYFLNNREDRKQVIKELRVDDAVSFDLFESKGFPYIDNIRKIDEKELKEVKEFEPTEEDMKRLHPPPREYKDETTKRCCIICAKDVFCEIYKKFGDEKGNKSIMKVAIDLVKQARDSF